MNSISLPDYWKSGLETIGSLAARAHRGRALCLTQSAGKRPVWCFCYGERQAIKSAANYNSACGAHDRESYLRLADKRPVILLAAGIHSQETEGIAALCNLISLLETGRDFGGAACPSLLDAAEGCRILLIPCANPDGRARVVPAAMAGRTNQELEYWGQGTWKDGSLCKWPDCKKVHPILSAAGFLGGYFNDDGINLMHDQFFRPMARETSALLELAAAEFADCVLLLHGGTNSLNELLQTAYVPVEVGEAIIRLARRCDAAAAKEGLHFSVAPLPCLPQGDTPPSFNLTSALHHVCGAVSAVFESNECIVDMPGAHLSVSEIYRSHLILFEQTFRHFRERIRG